MDQFETEMGLPDEDLTDAFEAAPEPFGADQPEEFEFDDWALI